MPETPVFATAAVAAPHSSAAEAGLMILAAGGNAVEATIAMAASASIACPHVSGLGGDGFWLVREPRGRVHALDASGPSGKEAGLRQYRRNGYDALPVRGPDATVTVAGAVAGWALALELARALGGHLPLDMILADAIRLARDGLAVSGRDAARKALQDKDLRASPGFAATFLSSDGKVPEAGALRRFPMLADTLGQLAHAGLGDFYRGDVGREIAADLERLGSPVRRKDLEEYRARALAPLSVALRSATVFAPPLPSQGIASLMVAGIMDRIDLRRGENAERHHAMVEAVKRAYAVRDRIVTDPRETPRDPGLFLEPTQLERESAAIDGQRAAPFRSVVPPQGNSAWMGCIDKNGLAVSYVQSLGPDFGSGCVLPGTGVLWHARGGGFSLDPSGWNPLEPGRKPFHALSPALAAFADGRVQILGAGGSDEPQAVAQIFARYAEIGMAPAEAVEAPRWLLEPEHGQEPACLRVEADFDPALARDLARRGHRMEEIGRDAGDGIGAAGMLVRHVRDGRVAATSDVRSEGAVLGL
ncbi:gamma-glutamyltransferase family protein [Microvirga rosea]|uniref:gamma-glutamyltransferase family protein n=1 Tax=Microvirga rosea TaxID=2715425 RepID=UPI001D0B05A6|nr:gamma-glutamyltransferase [Microvirga rosea]MCB8822435.1 gamma-glutamyltransferase [Microvirga rosea]